MSSKSKRKIYLTLLFSAGLIGILFLLPKIMLYWSGMTKTANSESKKFLIKSQVSIEILADQLYDEGIISNKSDFLKVAAYKKLSTKRIAIGMYEIAPQTDLRSLLNGFTLNAAGNGNAEIEIPVTFNNCRTIYDMAEKVSRCLALDSASLISLLQDKRNLAKYGFSLEQLPAMFIPNTYNMFYDTDEQEFVQRMANEFKLFWNDARKAQISRIGLQTPSEVSTLASIVYGEQSVNADEWPIIAGLYLNRIKKGIKLQSDPTFKFCWGDQLNGVQRLLAIHRNIDCPYNTYKIKGLPPGPINMPPSAVLDAVLNAADVNFIFMCAKPDYSGRHNFAVTGEEHMRNARIFQNWLTLEQKKKKQKK